MLPNIERGTSFKGVTAYLMHDKREGAADKGATNDRVGFTHLLNFIGDEARTPFEAAKVMALTVRDAEIIKAEAGIKPGGRKAEKPPVWHTSLSWHPSEQVDQAEMMRAVEGCLKAVGLELDKGYQTFIVQHTDEPQAHVHIVVNLVHPINGKQANPYRDQPKAQAWGLKYEQERGEIFCKAREDKYGDKTPEQTAFNAAAKGEPAPQRKPDQFGRNRDRKPREPRKAKTSRPEWQARKEAREKAQQEAATKLKGVINARFIELEAASAQQFVQRRNEAERFYTDRKDGRNAIYEKYQYGLDAIWQVIPEAPEVGPDRTPWLNFKKRLDARKDEFERREGSVLGRMANARALLKGKGGFFRLARLALNPTERRRLFDRDQRTFFAKNAPPRPKAQPRARVQEPRKVRSDRLKATRAAELATYDRQTRIDGAKMKARHSAEIDSDKAARRDLSRMASAAWERFAETNRNQDREAENQAREAAKRPNRTNGPENPEATQRSSTGRSGGTEPGKVWTAEQIAYFREQRRKEAEERAHEQDQENDRTP